MKRVRRSIIAKIIAMVMVVNCVASIGALLDMDTAYAAQTTEKTYFAQGKGTGEEFSADAWDITTLYYYDNTTAKYYDDKFKAGVVANHHSEEGEMLLRLINGMQYEDMKNVGTDSRSGVALMKGDIDLNRTGKFSVKVTFSMPEACRYDGYSRKEGGDGITFLITSNETITGNDGGGIGYEGIKNSLGVEFDSFYNTGNGRNYGEPAKKDADKYGHHVAVVLNGNSTKAEHHLATSFIYDSGYTAFSQEGSLTKYGEEVDTRLFTAWIEYDGNDLYVSYAKGDFETAVRPAKPQIVVDDKTTPAVKAQLDKFKNESIKVGFTSSIGSSKANHTIHSIAVVNDYIKNGISMSYTEEYYVESPDATSDYIEVNGKKYVKTKSNVVTGAAFGEEVSITDISDEMGKDFKAVDYSSVGYPGSVKEIAEDGSTTLYQFFDIIPKTSYTEKYIIEVKEPAPGDTIIEVDGVTYKVIETVVVTDVELDAKAEITDKSQDDFYSELEKVNPTDKLPSVVEDIADDGSTVVYQIYKEKPEYTVKYYLEVEEGTEGAIQIGDKYYVEQTEETVTDKAPTGTEVVYSDKDKATAGVKKDGEEVEDTFKSFDGYEFNKEATEEYGKIGGTLSDDVEIVIVFDKVEEIKESTNEDVKDPQPPVMDKDEVPTPEEPAEPEVPQDEEMQPTDPGIIIEDEDIPFADGGEPETLPQTGVLSVIICTLVGFALMVVGFKFVRYARIGV